MSEYQGIDISNITAEEPAQQPETETTEMSEEALLQELSQQDPILAMLAAQIFDMGKVVGDIAGRLELIERSVGYLLSKDGDLQKKMAEATDSVESPSENGIK